MLLLLLLRNGRSSCMEERSSIAAAAACSPTLAGQMAGWLAIAAASHGMHTNIRLFFKTHVGAYGGYDCTYIYIARVFVVVFYVGFVVAAGNKPLLYSLFLIVFLNAAQLNICMLG
jgi:hypothetical protein